MKLRNGFVSNSSSSSFICCVTGHNEAGSDCVGIEEYGFYCCINGHEFLQEYLVPVETDVTEETDDGCGCGGSCECEGCDCDDDDYDDDDDDFNPYEIPACQCPICTMKYFTTENLLAYMILKSGKERAVIEQEIRDTFTDFDAFRNFINNK